jgi:uncharacterized protein YjaZ
MVTIDLKTTSGETDGIFYHNSERIVVYLANHETLTDILSTIRHELIHHAIFRCGEDMDDDQEEKLVFFMSWAEEFL